MHWFCAPNHLVKWDSDSRVTELLLAIFDGMMHMEVCGTIVAAAVTITGIGDGVRGPGEIGSGHLA